jgi:hypothetical protein
MPLEFAALMGYGPSDLRHESVEGVGGLASGFHAIRPSSAHVVGLDAVQFEIRPCFVSGNDMVLWGRADFFHVFGIAFDEPAQQFHLSRPD